jgi:tight adherence protein B
MEAPIIATLVFVALVSLIVGLWWVFAPSRNVRGRLAGPAGTVGLPDLDIVLTKTTPSKLTSARALASLLERAGYTRTVNEVAMIIVGFALVGAALGALRVGGALWALVGAALAGSLPIVYLSYRANQRVNRFQRDFPDAVDMMTRAIRAGHAMGSSIRLVSEEMPAPVGPEFARVAEEMRLGRDLGEALAGLEQRVPAEDVRFFCTAVSIQRTTGGNLAEVLDRLAEVIRERFKLLSHARVLSTQHRWSAIIVGLSPIVFAILFQLINPDYFTAFFESPSAPTFMALGLAFEAVGFFIIWRISKIKV